MKISQTSILKWTKVLSKFISVQLIVQGLGFASGILLIRSLSKEEYAYFTIANSMQGMMNVLADSGISSALSAIGGKVWQDPYRFGQLINTAMQWRRYLAIVAIIVVTPILIWMLVQNGAPVGYTLVLVVGILIELDFYLKIGVLGTVLRLHSQIDRIQKLDLLGAGSRLALLLGCFSFLSAGVGVFVSTIASGLQSLLITQWIKNTIDTEAPKNKGYEKDISRLIRDQAPNNIFYCVQGQLTVWLISIFGTTQNIAEIGALSRLGAVFSILNAIMNNIILPSFARCQSANTFTKRYFQISFFYTILAIILLSLSAFLPRQFLWILGEQYSHLSNEVFLMVLSSVVSAIYGLSWLINLAKGWLGQTWLLILVITLSQFILLFTFDFSSISNVILFNILPLIPAYCINTYITIQGLKKLEAEQ